MPVGDEAARWATRGLCRRVLLVVHNVTSATRLLDVLPLFRDDFRIQLLATCTGSSPFQGGVGELLAAVGVPVLPWEQALDTPVDLAISASLGGQLHALRGKLAVLSHGIGYNKRLAPPERRNAGTPERRNAGTPERRNAGTPERRNAGTPVFGLSPDWVLTPEGVPVADAFVLSHPEQLDRLRAACPEAAPAALLAGDPCYDRMLAARCHRDRFRRALGVHDGQRLVVLNSTWNPESLFGDGGAEDLLPVLLPRLVSELPLDEYRLAAVLHPNIWQGHGPGQVRAWTDRARRAGLALVDPIEGWRQALIAADVVIGDFGSVSYYAAALGTPVLVGTTSHDALDEGSPVAAFVRQAPRLDPYGPLEKQVSALLASHTPPRWPAEFTTSAPGGSAALLRRAFYALIGIDEPAGPAVLDPLPLPPYEPRVCTAPVRVVTRVAATNEVVVTRYADPRHEPDGAGGYVHTAVHEDALDPGVLSHADVIWRHGDRDDPRLGRPEAWAARTLTRFPHCSVAAYLTGPAECVVRTRDGATLWLTGAPGAADPAAWVCALHGSLSEGRTVRDLAADGLVVVTGPAAHTVSVSLPR
ncbi:hypothetical protein CK485_12025 [Streptomyces sp. ICBB 8177]|nr:hypothetical protein CK485_12025 [Streptomyces sp. ICBB 8177]